MKVFCTAMTFEELKLTRQFLRAIEESGFAAPTEIQQKAIPRIFAGQDVIGIAQTGTGKTAAYLLPLLQVLKFAQGSEARCLILVPTKELVIQVEKNIAQLALYTDLRWVALYGGVGPKAQIEKLKEGVDIIVATPGRFLEVYAKREILPKKVKHIVLDECDRMMDMGFWHQLKEIQEKFPQKKQLLLFSATFPEKVEKLSENFLLFPQRIEVTPQATAATTIAQAVYYLPNQTAKLNLLIHLLRDDFLNRVIVFARTKNDVDAVAKALTNLRNGVVRTLHSNKGQNARINAMEEFSGGSVRVLVSTDVTARGIDVLEVSHVVNFSVPSKHEDYVHRIGRTGRAFKTGMAITFCDPSELYHLQKIQKLIRQQIPEIIIPDGVSIPSTPFEESQLQLREIDRQKRLEDPNFKGGFHEKKKIPGKKFDPKRNKRKKK